ncbi:hypothetical protein P153DRAFT_404235 [Dothidotthia symphoricarpi CBS 119687]|uniref:Ecp2 effector protein domain-containing protein n=1 Tax=Dothidotthia symphoricarpi CBS 119687 TaxID=1392245 RepID=A0A6A6AB82_9PLEO|nr:uncharacterized protein P153DRAFT_404235 [Dothidotthia symphoricarpi CBS 119687]KAF2129192.1 hypothetical protein P153DRAFT_404235 [Dothidotthia symphoricarpi CBS 119687]
MRASTLLLLLPATLAASYVIPNDTKDGVYATYTDDSGNEVHELIGKGVEVQSAESTIEARDNRTWQTWCGCGIGLDHGNTDAAVQDLKNQIGPNQINQNNVNYYSIRGNVVAFSCIQEAWFTTSEASYLTNAFAEITSRCGWYIAGTAQLSPDGAADPSVVGYMQYSNGLNFCGNAASSNRASC